MLHQSTKNMMRWGSAVVAVLLSLYAATIIFMAGQILLGTVVLAVSGLALFIYLSNRAHTYRYLFPGLLGMAVFVIFPLLYTVWIGFTNYSSQHLLTAERATQYFLDETYRITRASYSFKLYADNSDYRLLLESSESGERFITPPIALNNTQLETVETKAFNQGELGAAEPLTLREVIKRRAALKNLQLKFPDGTQASMSGLRNFEPLAPRYVQHADGSLQDLKEGGALTPNFETGFFEDDAGNSISPGFRVNIGFANFIRVFTQPEFQGPFVRIFIWTLLFAGLSVLFILAVGSTLAVLLSWEALRFRVLYRVLLFLPYAVPTFISILIFKGLFNNNFGEINLVLDTLFGIKPMWFSDPLLAKTMLLIVNTWLGYPYIMLLCMGLLKSIPSDLYEASAIAGAGPLTNFFKITAPLLIKPLTPLLIAIFAYNFNNFVLIALLTEGRPDFLDTKVPAGTTDILVSYTYRIAFEDSGKNFGLAAAIATLIFVMVAILALVQLKFTKSAEADKK